MWKDLKMSEKNDIIAYAVSQGITDIDDIRKYYQDGNLFGGGGKKKSSSSNSKSREDTFYSYYDKAAANSAYSDAAWRSFFRDLAYRESGLNGSIVGPALITGKNAGTRGRGYFGIMDYSKGNYKWDTKDPSTMGEQFKNAFWLMDTNMKYLKKHMTPKDYEKAEELGLDMYGLAAGTWAAGPGGVLRILRSDKDIKDQVFGVSTLKRMRDFSGKYGQLDVEDPQDIQTPQQVVYRIYEPHYDLPKSVNPELIDAIQQQISSIPQFNNIETTAKKAQEQEPYYTDIIPLQKELIQPKVNSTYSPLSSVMNTYNELLNQVNLGNLHGDGGTLDKGVRNNSAQPTPINEDSYEDWYLRNGEPVTVTIPAIDIKPTPRDNTNIQYMRQYMPSQNLRNLFYNYIDNLPKGALTRFINVHSYSGRPKFLSPEEYASLKNNFILGLYYRQKDVEENTNNGGWDFRSFNSGWPLNQNVITTSARDWKEYGNVMNPVIAELAHSYNRTSPNGKQVEGIYVEGSDNGIGAQVLGKGRTPSAYDIFGTSEYNAHEITQPAIQNYVFFGGEQGLNFQDYLRQAYSHQNNKVNSGERYFIDPNLNATDSDGYIPTENVTLSFKDPNLGMEYLQYNLYPGGNAFKLENSNYTPSTYAKGGPVKRFNKVSKNIAQYIKGIIPLLSLQKNEIPPFLTEYPDGSLVSQYYSDDKTAPDRLLMSFKNKTPGAKSFRKHWIPTVFDGSGIQYRYITSKPQGPTSAGYSFYDSQDSDIDDLIPIEDGLYRDWEGKEYYEDEEGNIFEEGYGPKYFLDDPYDYAKGGPLKNGTAASYRDAAWSGNNEYIGEPNREYIKPIFANMPIWMLDKVVPEDSRGHRDDIIKSDLHPTSPERGTFKEINGVPVYELSDVGMQDPNYSIFGADDNNDGHVIVTNNGAAVIPEITITPNGNYYEDNYDGFKHYYNKGGKIHIKPSKRGTFTAAAKKHGKSVQQFASQVLANRDKYSSAMVKKANFARNAAKWHGYGGNLFYEGGPEDDLPKIEDQDPTEETQEEYYTRKSNEIVRERKALESQYAIPVILSKIISLTGDTPYKDRGAIFSENLLDSIYKNANAVGLPFAEGLGLVAQESTLANAKNRGMGVGYGHENNNGTWTPRRIGMQYSPVVVTSDWSYINDNPYNDALAYARKKSNTEQRLKDGLTYTENQMKKFKLRTPPLQHAFELFKAGKYNPGEPDHRLKVIKRGEDIIKYSPEVQRWMKRNNIK